MNGAQDLGGAHGFGPVVAEQDEPPFHAEWERRVFAMAMAMGFTGAWNLDGSRSARESLPPAEYLAASYYEIWLRALEDQIVGAGLATREELAKGQSLDKPRQLQRRLEADAIGPKFDAGFPSTRPASAGPAFKVGQRVRARNDHPVGHTRLPRYARGKCGEVERVHGAFVFPDDSARGADNGPQWLYTVGFGATELWGDNGRPGDRVSFEAFESYLVPDDQR